MGTPTSRMVRRAAALSPIRRICCGRGPDEGDLAALADLGELGVLGQEAVARVDGVGAGDLGRGDDARDVQVALARRRRPDADLLVGEAHVQRLAVGLGVDGDGADAELLAGADDPQRDLAAVGDQDLAEHVSAPPAAGRLEGEVGGGLACPQARSANSAGLVA